MVLAEIILYALLIGGTGTYVGYQVNQPTPEHRTPMEWKPRQHIQLLKMCGLVCGERSIHSYNAAYGKCECSQNKEKKGR